MKNTYFLYLIWILSISFSACNKSFDYREPLPSINFADDVDNKGGIRGGNVRIRLNLQAVSQLASLRVFESLNGSPAVQIDEISSFEDNFRESAFLYNYLVDTTANPSLAIGDQIKVIFELDDLAGRTTNPIEFTINVVGALFLENTVGLAGENFIALAPPAGINVTVINEDEYTFETGKKYLIQGRLQIEEGLTVILQPGTEIYASTANPNNIAVFEVPAESRILAEGTPDNPILMSSDRVFSGNPAPGDWQGLEVVGRGGNDNAGILRYLRVEYGGKDAIDLENTGAIRLVEVGSGTSIDHVQVFQSSGHAIRFNGGSVNARYLVATEVGDDAFRCDNNDVPSGTGYSGLGQFWYSENLTDSDIEGLEIRDGAFPTLCNISLIGPGQSGTSQMAATRLRDNTLGYRIYNALMAEYPDDGLREDGAIDIALGLEGNKVVAYSSIFGIGDDDVRGEAEKFKLNP
ncbi:MAG: hypothetical protein HC880_12510, partial [Bacteroidia bacterium]|nr:hypothetical protein [Bacteroidia bacterium]